MTASMKMTMRVAMTRMMMSDPSLAPCSFFSLFGALMPKGEKNYLSMLLVHRFIGFGLYDLKLAFVGHVDMF
jgi:hypothetical protein